MGSPIKTSLINASEGIRDFLERCLRADRSEKSAHFLDVNGMDVKGLRISVEEHLRRGSSLAKLTEDHAIFEWRLRRRSGVYFGSCQLDHGQSVNESLRFMGLLSLHFRLCFLRWRYLKIEFLWRLLMSQQLPHWLAITITPCLLCRNTPRYEQLIERRYDSRLQTWIPMKYICLRGCLYIR